MTETNGWTLGGSSYFHLSMIFFKMFRKTLKFDQLSFVFFFFASRVYSNLLQCCLIVFCGWYRNYGLWNSNMNNLILKCTLIINVIILHRYAFTNINIVRINMRLWRTFVCNLQGLLFLSYRNNVVKMRFRLMNSHMYFSIL